jgi:hypothetical protein
VQLQNPYRPRAERVLVLAQQGAFGKPGARVLHLRAERSYASLAPVLARTSPTMARSVPAPTALRLLVASEAILLRERRTHGKALAQEMLMEPPRPGRKA